MSFFVLMFAWFAVAVDQGEAVVLDQFTDRLDRFFVFFRRMELFYQFNLRTVIAHFLHSRNLVFLRYVQSDFFKPRIQPINAAAAPATKEIK